MFGLSWDQIDLQVEGKFPVVVRGPIERLGAVPTLIEIEKYLVRQRLSFSQFRLTDLSERGEANPLTYVGITKKVGRKQIVRVINLPAAAKIIAQGAMVVVNKVYQISSGALELKREIERHLGVEVGDFICVAQNGRGFRPHQDSSDGL